MVLAIRSEIFDDESRGEKNSYENVEIVYGQQYFLSVEKQDMPTFQEYSREREGKVSRASFENTKLNEKRANNRAGNIETIIATEDLMMDTRTTQTMSNADKVQNKSRDLSKIDILDDHTNWDNIHKRIAVIKAQKKKSKQS